jgi:hypothetical protein
MATGKQLKAAILARRVAKGPRKKRTRPKPRQISNPFLPSVIQTPSSSPGFFTRWVRMGCLH